MWKHSCPVDGEMEVGDGEPCNWCGATESKPKIAVLAFLLLTGCAQAPISEHPVPQTEKSACVVLSEKHSIVERAALRGGIEAARASGVAYGISQISPAIVASSILPYIAAGYAITSGIGGAIEAQDRRDQIVRECLRDRGYKVY